MSSLFCIIFVFCACIALSECTPVFEKEMEVAEDALADVEYRRFEGRPKDCSELYYAGQTHSGVYNIFPFEDNSKRVAAYCDMETDGGGWTVIQKRGQYGNPAYYFYRDWEDYAQGFGNPAEEYWIGNRAIHALTSSKPMELRIHLKNHTEETLTADYKLFEVANEKELFRIKVGEYAGDKGADAFSAVNGSVFSTRDKGSQPEKQGCAVKYRGGWWYVWCHTANLNGLNLNGPHDSYADGIEWSVRHNMTRLYYYSYKECQMKIRSLDFENTQYV